jgi:solute:Na+ symporter, SSS family
MAEFGVVMVVVACVLQDVSRRSRRPATSWLGIADANPGRPGVAARHQVGAVAAMAVGTVVTLATMVVVGVIYANEPIYFGLVSGPVVLAVGSLLTPPTAPDVLAEWDWRGRGEQTAPVRPHRVSQRDVEGATGKEVCENATPWAGIGYAPQRSAA